MPVLIDLAPILDMIDETLANTNMILGSRFVAPLRHEAEQMKVYIMTIDEMLSQWMKL